MADITTDFLITDQATLEVGGVVGRMFIFNYDEWVMSTITKADGVITAISLATIGAKSTEYALTRGSIVPSTPLTVNNGGKGGFVHTLPIFIATKSQAVKNELASKINLGRSVIVVLLDSSIVAQVFGDGVGLQLTAYDELPNDPSKGGGIQCTFSTPTDVTVENMPPATCFITSRAATIAMLEATKTPVV